MHNLLITGLYLISLLYVTLSFSGFRRNEEMKAMEVLPILKEKVAFLSGRPCSGFVWEHKMTNVVRLSFVIT